MISAIGKDTDSGVFRQNFQTYTAKCGPVGVPINIPFEGDCLVLKSATGTINVSAPGLPTNVLTPLGRVFKLDGGFGALTVTSTVANDVVTFDIGYGLIIPTDQFPGASATAPASVVAATGEQFSGIVTPGTYASINFKFECPFSILQITGTYTFNPGASCVSGVPVGGSFAYPLTIYDLNGNIISESGVLPNATAGATYLIDTTGLMLIQLYLSGTGSFAYTLTASHTQNTIFNSLPKKEVTYTSTSSFAPITGATDAWYIPGVNGIKVTVKKIIVQLNVTGFALGAATPFIAKRSTLDTGGTPTNQPGIPFDSGFVAPLAKPISFAAIPSSLGTLMQILRPMQPNFVVVGAYTVFYQEFDFDSNPNENAYILNGPLENIVVNFGGATITNGKAVITCVWSEK